MMIKQYVVTREGGHRSQHAPARAQHPHVVQLFSATQFRHADLPVSGDGAASSNGGDEPDGG
jgi:hypothetical protein